MDNLEAPQVISAPVASSSTALKNQIPDEPTGSYLASVQEGFPPITMLPQEQGGEAPDGKDFNGLFNLMSQFYYYTQNGGTYTFVPEVSDAIGGIVKKCVAVAVKETLGAILSPKEPLIAELKPNEKLTKAERKLAEAVVEFGFEKERIGKIKGMLEGAMNAELVEIMKHVEPI